jgi:hypothetical protein
MTRRYRHLRLSSQDALAAMMAASGGPMYQFVQLLNFPVLGGDYLIEDPLLVDYLFANGPGSVALKPCIRMEEAQGRPDFLESDFKRQQTPRRRVNLQTSSGWLLLKARDLINRERRRGWRVCRPRPRATGHSAANGPDRYDKCVF